jgi:hypothetical protein
MIAESERATWHADRSVLAILPLLVARGGHRAAVLVLAICPGSQVAAHGYPPVTGEHALGA